MRNEKAKGKETHYYFLQELFIRDIKPTLHYITFFLHNLHPHVLLS